MVKLPGRIVVKRSARYLSKADQGNSTAAPSQLAQAFAPLCRQPYHFVPTPGSGFQASRPHTSSKPLPPATIFTRLAVWTIMGGLDMGSHEWLP